MVVSSGLHIIVASVHGMLSLRRHVFRLAFTGFHYIFDFLFCFASKFMRFVAHFVEFSLVCHFTDSISGCDSSSQT